jgi:adenylate cyclase
MPAFRLVPVGEGDPIELGEGRPRVVGRLQTSDVPIFDVSISREHAELALLADGVRVRDLGSTNGVFINGARVHDHVAVVGDLVTLGSVHFRVQRAAVGDENAGTTVDLGTARYEVNVVKKVAVNELVASPPAGAPEGGAAAGRSSGLLSLVRGLAEEKAAVKLAALLELATELGRQPDVDVLLQRIVDLAFNALQADRASLLVVEGDALALEARAVRVRRGTPEDGGRVPRAIAYQVLTERVAVLSDNVGDDSRFSSESAHRLSRHSALCIPLVGQGQQVLGLLYLENADRQHPFDAEDLELMTAFGGLAAAALDHQLLERRQRQEGEVLERLQRYLSPSVAAEVALRAGEVSLLRPARRPAVLLCCHLHDFAAQADALAPEDLAELLGAYLSRLCAAIFEYGGTLDNVRGHAVLALWGAPVARAGDVDRALRAAMAAREAVAELGGAWQRRGVSRLALAAGIASGEVFVGEVTSGQRSEYAVVGTLADAAALLCAEAAGGEILVGEPFYRALSNPPPARGQRVRGVAGEARRLG